MDITEQLQNLFALEKTLLNLLENEEYEQFQQQQESFSDQIKALLDGNKAEVLSTKIDQLKQLESAVELLHKKSDGCFQALKNKALLQQRNKGKIKAYGDK